MVAVLLDYIMNIFWEVLFEQLAKILNLQGGNTFSSHTIIQILNKPRRRRQQQLGKTKDLMGKTIAQYVCLKTLFISLPSSAKQTLEIT